MRSSGRWHIATPRTYFTPAIDTSSTPDYTRAKWPYRLRVGTFPCSEGDAMLYWAVVFLVIALVAALFGFGGIAVAAAGIAKVLFFLFVIIFVVTLTMGLMRRRRPL